jgi:hypothetical protein
LPAYRCTTALAVCDARRERVAKTGAFHPADAVQAFVKLTGRGDDAMPENAA